MSSSSSDFSSDDEQDEQDELDLEETSQQGPKVQKLREEEEEEESHKEEEESDSDWVAAPPSANTTDAAFDESDVQPCCVQAVQQLLDNDQMRFCYDAYTLVLNHLQQHGVSSSSSESESEPSDPALQRKLTGYAAYRVQVLARFQQVFPLTGTMVRQWIDDIHTLHAVPATSPSAHVSKRQLVLECKSIYEKALADYWDFDLYLTYLRFLQENLMEIGGGGGTRELDKRIATALQTIGFHYTRGHEVWALAREVIAQQFDQQLDYGNQQQQPPTPQQEVLMALQKEKRLRELYCAQMQIPLQQNDFCMSEFRGWNAHNVKEAAFAREQAFAAAEKRQQRDFAVIKKRMDEYERRLEHSLAAAASGSAGVGTTNGSASTIEASGYLPDASTKQESLSTEQLWATYLNFIKYKLLPLIEPHERKYQMMTSYFERAVATVCLSSTLWQKYLEFVGSKTNIVEPQRFSSTASESGASSSSSSTRSPSRSAMKAKCTAQNSEINDEKLALIQRALRNVMCDSAIWVELLLEMEGQGIPTSEIAVTISDLLSRRPLLMDQYHYLNVLVTFCDIRRRHLVTKGFQKQHYNDLVTTFQLCEAFLVQHFPDFTDGLTRLWEYHAKCEVFYGRGVGTGTGLAALSTPKGLDLTKWNQLWQQILSKKGHEAQVWVDYFEESMRLGKSVESIRCLLREANDQVRDYPLAIAEMWLTFEREHGDLKNYLKVREIHAKLLQRQQKLNPHVQLAPAQSVWGQQDTDTTTASGTQNHGKDKKRAIATRDAPAGSSSTKKRRLGEPQRSTEQESGPANIQTAEPHDKSHEEMSETTLYVSNFSKKITEQDLEALFGTVQGLKQVRLLMKKRRNTHVSRGIAYVEYADQQATAEALKRFNGKDFCDQRLKVERAKAIGCSTEDKAKADDPSGVSSPQDHQSRDGKWKTDPSTLYVAGLDRPGAEAVNQLTDEDESVEHKLAHALEKLVGRVKQTLILVDRKGQPKDYALVEMVKQTDAAKCLANRNAISELIQKEIGNNGPLQLKPSRFSVDAIRQQQEQQKAQKAKARGKQSTGNNVRKKKQPPTAAPAAAGAHKTPAPRLSVSSLVPRAIKQKTTSDPKRPLQQPQKLQSASSSGHNATPASSASTATTASAARSKTNADFRAMLMTKKCR